jgi:hypothetical protein
MTTPSGSARAGFLIILLAFVFTYGLIRAFSIRFAAGDVYPDYSSMKASPPGAKLLYDSLSHTPGLTVSRNYSPLEYSDESDAAIFLLAVNPGVFAGAPQVFVDPVERLSNRGNRVVAALSWDGPKNPVIGEAIQKRWHIKLAYDTARKRLYFSGADDWRVLDRSGDRILAIERDFGKGAVVLFSDSRGFSNQSVVKLGHLELISTAIGPKGRVIFDEEHFGMGESGTVVGLARRYRLGGMALGFALYTALFIWRNAASFPPPAEAIRRETLSGRTSIAGLYTLLRRHIKPAELAAVCWNEWLTGNRRELSPERRARAEAILRDRGRAPLEAVREIQTVLHAKGPL